MDVPTTEIRVPTRGNRRLEALLAAANADRRLRTWWYMQQVNADRRDMSDHSWVHVQIVVNIPPRLFRLLGRAGVEPAMVSQHGMTPRDAEVVIAAARGSRSRRAAPTSTRFGCGDRRHHDRAG